MCLCERNRERDRERRRERERERERLKGRLTYIHTGLKFHPALQQRYWDEILYRQIELGLPGGGVVVTWD